MKRGVVLFSVFMLIFSFYSYDVSSVNMACGGCAEDADCNVDNNGNELPKYQWDYACRASENCIGGDPIEFQCTGGNDPNGYSKIQCSPVYSNGKSCILVEGYGDMEQNRCATEYSCDGNQLDIVHKTFSAGRDSCVDLETSNIDCTNINERCSDMNDTYGESCSCISNGETGGCVEPTKFITIQSSTGNCGTFESLYDSNGINFGTSDLYGSDLVTFYDDARLQYKLRNRGGLNDDSSWICNQNSGYAILDLGREYDIYAIRIYGGNIAFKLYTSLDRQNFDPINNGNSINLAHEPNYANRGGLINRNNVNELYFLFKFNERPENNEIYTNQVIRASYIKYEVIQGVNNNVNNNLGQEIVVEGKVAGDREPICGDGEINAGEQCDGNDLNGQSCGDYGYNKGALRCNEPDAARNRCRYDMSGCYYESNEIDFRLTVDSGRRIRNIDGGENLMCPGEDRNVRITLTNTDDGRRASPENLIIYDSIFYDEDCDGTGTLRSGRTFRDCNQLDYGESCIRTYSYLYADTGCYYHNVRVDGDAQ